MSEFVANDLKHASRKYYTVAFAGRGAKLKFLAASSSLSTCTLSSQTETAVDLSIEDRELNELIAMLSDSAVRSFSNRKETLEDYFMKFYKEEKNFGGALQ